MYARYKNLYDRIFSSTIIQSTISFLSTDEERRVYSKKYQDRESITYLLEGL